MDGLSVRHRAEDVRKRVGFLFQDPENQLVMWSVKRELAFGMENLGLERKEILERMERWSKLLGISHLMNRRTTELSGGEKQKVALASILSSGPDYLLLDEPTSQLDGEAASEFRKILSGLNRSGTTILLSSHHVEDGSRELCIRGGKPADCSALKKLWEKAGPIPDFRSKKILLEISDFSVGYKGADNRDGGNIVGDANLTLHAGEVAGITGANGSGKSTLLKGIMGLPRIRAKGRICMETGNGLQDISSLSTAQRARSIAYLGQYPGAYLFHGTLEDEINFSIERAGEGGQIRPDEIMERLSLTEYRYRNPRDLSSGEKERAALATVLISGQRIIVLDEPTRGMDPAKRLSLVKHIAGELSRGAGVIVATHDRELLRLLSATVYEVKGGRLRERGRYNG